MIIIKQTIHLLNDSDIKKLINYCKIKLNLNGVILVFTIDPNNNEIPSFKLMSDKLKKSLKRDKKILKLLQQNNVRKNLKKFEFNVKITKKKYIKMIQNRYISTLLTMTEDEISDGIKEIDTKFNKILKFKDNLICIFLKN